MPKATRKRRTREHIISDLSINFVERAVLRCGHTVERFWHDYGFDLLLYTYDNNGEYENGDVRLQVKATDHLIKTTDEAMVCWRIECGHLGHWLSEPMPVILVLYDARRDEAYWLYVQQHFQAHRHFLKRKGAVTISVKVPITSMLNEQAVRQFARFRDNILAQSRGVIRHHD